MEKSEYFIYLSQKNESEAAKNISLEIKAKFKTNPYFIFILFTPNYDPQNLLKIFNFTLKNPNIFGIQAPFLIYKNKVIEKGIISCCINKEGLKIDNLFIGSKDAEKIEYTLKSHFKKTKRKNIHLISFLSDQMDPSPFLEGIKRSLGKFVNFSGAGYQYKYSSHNQFILPKGIGDGIVNLNFNGIETRAYRLHNFVPFGKPFNITRSNNRQKIIHEINNKPAVNIYKHYLEEKFNTFIKNRLFAYYPLGISDENNFCLLTILDILEDGSLLFNGNLINTAKANLMVFKGDYSKKNLADELKNEKNKENGIVFMINSLSRKRQLGKNCLTEIKNVADFFQPEKEMIGIYSDYYLFSDSKTEDIITETGGLLINVWN